MNAHGISLLVAVTGGAVAQLSMKYAMLVACADVPCGISSYLQSTGFITFTVFGIGLYFLSFICWVVALRKYDLSLAYPVLSLGYVIVYIGAALPLFAEALSLQKSIGILLIVVGVLISSQRSLIPVQAVKT